ncbi:hypothetical protein MRX96_036120 [Rhipicephalus microplus]
MEGTQAVTAALASPNATEEAESCGEQSVDQVVFSCRSREVLRPENTVDSRGRRVEMLLRCLLAGMKRRALARRSACGQPLWRKAHGRSAKARPPERVHRERASDAESRAKLAPFASCLRGMQEKPEDGESAGSGRGGVLLLTGLGRFSSPGTVIQAPTGGRALAGRRFLGTGLPSSVDCPTLSAPPSPRIHLHRNLRGGGEHAECGMPGCSGTASSLSACSFVFVASRMRHAEFSL